MTWEDVQSSGAVCNRHWVRSPDFSAPTDPPAARCVCTFRIKESNSARTWCRVGRNLDAELTRLFECRPLHSLSFGPNRGWPVRECSASLDIDRSTEGTSGRKEAGHRWALVRTGGIGETHECEDREYGKLSSEAVHAKTSTRGSELGR